MSFFRFFGMPQIQPNPQSEWNAHQQQTQGDGELAQEARHMCKVLSNSRTYNSTPNRALRDAVNGDPEHYLYSRFATAFGWSTLGQAKDFYNRNKGSKGGWY